MFSEKKLIVITHRVDIPLSWVYIYIYITLCPDDLTFPLLFRYSTWVFRKKVMIVLQDGNFPQKFSYNFFKCYLRKLSLCIHGYLQVGIEHQFNIIISDIVQNLITKLFSSSIFCLEWIADVISKLLEQKLLI